MPFSLAKTRFGRRRSFAVVAPAGGGVGGVLASDTFTGTLDTFLENHTSDSGHAWTNLGAGGANRLSGDGCVYRFASPGFYTCGPALATANYQIDLVLNVKTVIASDLVIVGGRLVDASNAYRAYVNPTAIGLDKLIANVATNLGASPLANVLTVGAHTLSLRMSGDQISALWDGSVVIGPVTDSAFAAAGKAALRVGASAVVQTTSTGSQADRFTVTSL